MYARARFLFNHGYRQAAVRELCTDDRVRVHANNVHNLGALMDAAVVMQVCGFVLLRGLFSTELVSSLAASNREQFWSFYNESIAPHPELIQADSYETEDFAIRSRGRFEYKLPLEEPFTSSAMLGNAFLRGVLEASMQSPDITLDTFSCVVSLADTPVQHWFVACHVRAAASRPHPLCLQARRCRSTLRTALEHPSIKSVAPATTAKCLR
mgnify:CR=1 FL=1